MQPTTPAPDLETVTLHDTAPEDAVGAKLHGQWSSLADKILTRFDQDIVAALTVGPIAGHGDEAGGRT